MPALSDRWIKVGRFLVFAACYLLSVIGSEHLYGSLAVPSPFWFPDSVLLCALLLTPRDRWWVLLVTIWPIRLTVGAPIGTPYWFLIAAIAIDGLKGLLTAWLLQRILRRPIRLNTLHELMVFLAVAGVAVPLLSALAAAPLRHALGDPLWSAGYRWFLGNALAQVVVTPTLVYWCTARYSFLNVRWRELLVLSIGLMAALYYAFDLPPTGPSPSLLYAPVPFLLWAAVRLRPFGTSNAIALVATVAMLSAVDGRGAFSGNSSADSVLSIQLFLLVVAVSLLSLATLIAENQSTTEELKTVLDAAPVPILIAPDAECRHVTANRIGQQLHQPNGEQPDVPTAWLREVAATGTSISGDGFTSIQEDGTERYWLGYVAPLPGEGRTPRGAVGTFLDVTARTLAEASLRESEERFRLIADTAPVLIWMSGPDKRHTLLTKAWSDFTGRAIEQGLGDGWLADVHPEDRDVCQELYSRAFDGRVDFENEVRLRRYDGEYRWMAGRGVPRFDAKGVFAGYIGSAVDITDRKLAEMWRQQVNGRLIDAQEQERARIARELHDDFGQRMALLQIGIEQFGQDLQGLSLYHRQQLRLLVEMTTQISAEMHDLSHQLHPSTLEVLGLVNALGGLCRAFSEQHQLSVKLVHHDVPKRIARPVSLSLFRIAQEALRNVVKHSGVADAAVELSGRGGHLELCVSDSGAGFEPEAATRKGGLGLVSMHERLRPIGGRLIIRSSPLGGTEIRAHVPATVG